MRIIVPIKQVPETNAVRLDEETGTMVRSGVEAIVNPLDLYAIETALRLRERHGGEVVALSMGPPAAEAALREAVAMGLDSGVLVSDRLLAGSDTWSTAFALAAAVRKLGAFDWILCGERATDGDTGQVGPALAAFLDLPAVTYVSRFEWNGQGRARVTRLIEGGYETVAVEPPAVCTMVKEIAAPRLPTLVGKQRARTVDIQKWGIAELGIPPDKVGLRGSPTRVVRIHRPQVARRGTLIHAVGPDAAEQAAERILDFLRGHGLLRREEIRGR